MEKILDKIDELSTFHNQVSPKLVKDRNIKLGLRNADGTGVPVGITSKGTVIGYIKEKDSKGNEKVIPCEGRLLYCGYDVADLVRSIHSEERFSFDEVCYLLLSGELPNCEDLKNFTRTLKKRRPLGRLERTLLFEVTANENQMYALHSMVSSLGRLDKHPDSNSLDDEIQRCINLIAKMPVIVAYNYNMMRYGRGDNLNLIQPDPNLTTAENFLYMLNGDKPNVLEAYLFDMALSLHAEHGGGNNSTFSVRTVSSSGANTYMAITAGIASLSGHLHGGANEAVERMMTDLKKNVKDWEDRQELKNYIEKIIDKKVGDKSGKVYGLGHAVYTLSDPRAVLFKEKAKAYSTMKGKDKEFNLYESVATIASDVLKSRKGVPINANVDFYSGFIYKMMGIPSELFTPVFAMSRVVGWAAHRIEQIMQGKIMRPAYVSSLLKDEKYIPMKDRK